MDYKTPSGGNTGANSTPRLGGSPIYLSDEVRKELVQKLKCNPDQTAADAMEEDGHASQHTGMPEKSVNTLQTAGNEINQAKKSKDMAIELSLQRRKVADVEKKAEDDRARLEAEASKRMDEVKQQAVDEMAALQAQIDYFKSLALAGSATQDGNARQGSPHHSGSGTSPSSQMETEDRRAAGDK